MDVKIKITKEQSKDTGMALLLILLLLGLFLENGIYFKIAIPVLIINMIFPMFFFPMAIVWLGFSRLLGTIMSRVILTLVFIILVIPVGLIRRLIGKDTLKLKQFKNGDESVMEVRNHLFSSDDLEKIF